MTSSPKQSGKMTTPTDVVQQVGDIEHRLHTVRENYRNADVAPEITFTTAAGTTVIGNIVEFGTQTIGPVQIQPDQFTIPKIRAVLYDTTAAEPQVHEFVTSITVGNTRKTLSDELASQLSDLNNSDDTDIVSTETKLQDAITDKSEPTHPSVTPTYKTTDYRFSVDVTASTPQRYNEEGSYRRTTVQISNLDRIIVQ